MKAMPHKKLSRIASAALALIMAVSVFMVSPEPASAVTCTSQITTNAGTNTVTLTGCKSGKEYVISVVKGSRTNYKVTDSSLLYINQKKASGSKLEFKVPIKTKDRVVVIVSSNDKAGTYPQVIGEANVPISAASITVSSPTYKGKKVSPSTTVKYNGKTLTKGKDYTWTASAKNVGSYSFTIQGKGLYNGSIKKTYQVKPPAKSISSLKKGKKQITVKWKKYSTKERKKYKSQIKGFQIQYSTKANFSGAKTVSGGGITKSSKVIKKLKSKTRYYVRIRTYKGKCYSNWSKAKSVVVK